MEKRVNHKDTGKPQTQGAKHQQGLEEILQKSSRLMANVGFHGTSMRELSRTTGRSLAGLYHYFGSKEDLLYLINYHGFTTLNETWKKMSESFESPEEKLYGFIYLHTQYYVANMNEMRVMNWGTQELEYGRAMAIKKLKDRHTADARAVIKETHQAATGESISPKRLARQTFLLFGMMNWIFGWYSSATHGAVDELIRDIYHMFMYGAHRLRGPAKDMDMIESRVRDSFRRHSRDNIWDTAQAPQLKPPE